MRRSLAVATMLVLPALTMEAQGIGRGPGSGNRSDSSGPPVTTPPNFTPPGPPPKQPGYGNPRLQGNRTAKGALNVPAPADLKNSWQTTFELERPVAVVAEELVKGTAPVFGSRCGTAASMVASAEVGSAEMVLPRSCPTVPAVSGVLVAQLGVDDRRDGFSDDVLDELVKSITAKKGAPPKVTVRRFLRTFGGNFVDPDPRWVVYSATHFNAMVNAASGDYLAEPPAEFAALRYAMEQLMKMNGY